MAKLKIKPGSMKRLQVKIKGTSPLIVNKWSQKAVQKLKDKILGKPREKNQPADPQKEFEERRYRFSDGGDGFPVNAVKASIINACRNTKTSWKHCV